MGSPLPLHKSAESQVGGLSLTSPSQLVYLLILTRLTIIFHFKLGLACLESVRYRVFLQDLYQFSVVTCWEAQMNQFVNNLRKDINRQAQKLFSAFSVNFNIQ